MQNLKTTIDLPKIKPIKEKSDEKYLYEGKKLKDQSFISNLQNDQFLSRKSLSSTKKSNFEVYYGNAPLGVPIKELQDQSSISNLQNDQLLSRKSLSPVKKSNFEVYYGDAPLGVPFKWEIQPGTPKVKTLETPLPPLTPPPSFLEKKKKKNATKHQTKGKLLQRLFFLPKLNLRKCQLQPSPTSSSSSSSLSSSSFSSPPRCWSYSVPASPCRVKSNF
ncbi:hypothetical protein HAX54_027741 [Datura stramonium]|uniref:Uncharacterized protein n=1 Tax=Datura stramonium TaxID=4076 RepID=A0ABS8V5K3_DATST|nr:hypothetical protein [Datura stramonium]